MPNPKPLRIVFMGTPDFAAHILEQLCKSKLCEVVGVYCQPDRPAGRGKNLTPPPVKLTAKNFNLPVFQPLTFKNPAEIEELSNLNPDVLAVAAYGLILPQVVLDTANIAPINVHASILPLYRGAAPIQRAIIDAQEETGISIMRMEAGLDTGPVYATKTIPIGNHTAGTLHNELAADGAKLLLLVLEKLQKGSFAPVEQEHEKATYASKLSKLDSVIDWQKPAKLVDAHIRGVTPWPGAKLSFLSPQEKKFDLTIVQGSIGPEKALYASNFNVDPNLLSAGHLWRLEKNIIAISCVDNFYILDKVKPINKSIMDAADFARGYFGNELGLLAKL